MNNKSNNFDIYTSLGESFSPQCKGYLDTINNNDWISFDITKQIECCINDTKPMFDYCNEYCDKNAIKLFDETFKNKPYKFSDESAIKRCKADCSITHNIAIDSCRTLSPLFQSDSIWNNCYDMYCKRDYSAISVDSSEKKEYNESNLECFNKNLDKIVNCTKNLCETKYSINCDDYVNFMKERILKGNFDLEVYLRDNEIDLKKLVKNSNFKQENNKNNNNKNNNKNNNNNNKQNWNKNWNNIILSAILGVIVAFIIIILFIIFRK